MIRIQIKRKCYVCGKETTHYSGICLNCRNKSSPIQGDVCFKCGIPLISEKTICLRCRTIDYHFDRNDSLFFYADMARDIFFQYKFRKHKRIAFWFCELIADRIFRDFQGYLLVPSPFRYFKKIKKGWDQVQWICRILKKRHGLVSQSLLRRCSGTDQKLLDLNGRRQNLRGSIVFRKGILSIKGENVLFIDDVFTTGATADECARILKKNGASEVAVLTIAID